MTDQLLARVVVDPGGPEPDRPATTSHPTATARDGATGRPLDRRAYAGEMLGRLARESLAAIDTATGEPARTAGLSSAEAEVVAELLDELAGVYPAEELGQLAGSLSARLWQRVGP